MATSGSTQTTFEIPLSAGDINAIARLARANAIPMEHPFVTDVRAVAEDEQERFDVDFGFRDTYTVETTAGRAREAAKQLYQYQLGDTDRSERFNATFIRKIVRATSAQEHAAAHVDAITEQRELPTEIARETATEAYAILAGEFRRACSLRPDTREDYVETRESLRALDSIRPSQVEKLSRVLGDITPPQTEERSRVLGQIRGASQTDAVYLNSLFTPSDADPVNAPLRDEFGLGAIPAEP